MLRSAGLKARRIMLSTAAALVMGAALLPATPAVAWHYEANCDGLGLFVTGSITFPTNTAPFTVTLQQRVDESWQNVPLATQLIFPSASATEASFMFSTLLANPFADGIRVVNSATREVSPTLPPCLPLD